MNDDRKKVWVDHFQTRLFRRILAYLAIYLVCLGNLLFIWRLLTEGAGNPLEQYGRMLVDYAPALVFLALLLPVLAWDAIKFSHRLVGPLVRFRRTMEDVAEGRPVQPIKLRQGDFLSELRDDFNTMLESLQRRGVEVLKPVEAAQDERKRTA